MVLLGLTCACVLKVVIKNSVQLFALEPAPDTPPKNKYEMGRTNGAVRLSSLYAIRLSLLRIAAQCSERQFVTIRRPS